MALCAMVVFDPPDEPRTALLENCLASLMTTVDWSRHRLVISNNGITSDSYLAIASHFNDALGFRPEVIENGSNLGTARAINRVWQQRKPGQHCLKIDSDVMMNEPGWLDKLEACIAADPKIGIIGLKRKDLDESPNTPPGDWRHSTLRMLPHRKGEPWLIVERVNHVLGSCCLFNSALLDKIGYLVQFGQYGLDDGLAAVRCEKAGFYSCFYDHYVILHPDPGTCEHTQWKIEQARKYLPLYHQYVEQYRRGTRNIYHGPDEDLA